MSQVFPFRASMIKWALLFKDSMSGTEERVKLPDCHTNCKGTNRSKPKRSPPRGIAWTFTPGKFRSRISEAASPNCCCSHAALLPLDLAGVRRGLAKMFLTVDYRLCKD